MQFNVDRDLLYVHIQRVNKVTPTRSTMPILSSVLFQLKGDELTLRTSDIEVTMYTTLKVEGKQDGDLAIPASFIQGIVNELEKGVIEIRADENGKVIIRSDDGHYEINGRPAEEFPSIPKIKSTQDIELNNDVLIRMIRKTLVAVGKDELKPALLGVLFQIHEKELRLVSSDVHRLVCIVRKDFSSPAYQRDVIIPTKFLNLLLAYLKPDDKVTLSVSENHVKVEFDSLVLFSRLIDEKFPDYESVLPTDNEKEAKFNTQDIIATLKRVAIFSNQATHQISFLIKTEGSKITTLSREASTRAEEEIELEYDNEQIMIGFNAVYFRELLGNIDTENTIMKLDSPLSANLILPDEQRENEDLMMILMPIRLEENEPA